MSNTFGSIFRLTTFGESHGVSIGGVIDGFPAGFKINLDAVQRKLNLRRPSQTGFFGQPDFLARLDYHIHRRTHNSTYQF